MKMEKLNLERDFSRFLDKEDFPHEVSVCFGDKKFATCSGMLLAQQSFIIEDIICENKGVLTLNNLEGYSVADIMECLSFLYGADIVLSLENIGTILTFSSLYEIGSMFSFAFDWILESVTVKNLIALYEALSDLSAKHKHMLLHVFDNFLADNLADVMMEARYCIKEGKGIGCDFLCAILQQSYSSCGDIVLAWIAEGPGNVAFVLANMDSLDIFKNFPLADDFTKLISHFSANANSLQAMEQLIELQHKYFTRQSKVAPHSELSPNEQTVATFSQDPGCNAAQFYAFNDGLLHLESGSDHDYNYPFTVSVLNIPIYASNEDVELTFSGVGPVKHVLLININCFNQLAFVSFETESSVEKSLLSDIFIYRNKLAVKSVIQPTRSDSSEKRLFIKKIPVNASKRDIQRCFSWYGPVKDVEIIRHKKCAFIELFESKVVAILIHFAINGVTFRILGQNVLIEEFKINKKHGKRK